MPNSPITFLPPPSTSPNGVGAGIDWSQIFKPQVPPMVPTQSGPAGVPPMNTGGIDWSHIFAPTNPVGTHQPAPAPLPTGPGAPPGMTVGMPSPAAPTIPTGAAAQEQPSPASSGVSGRTQGLGDLSDILGSFSSGEKANRALEGQFSQNYDNIMLDAAKNRRDDESDALKKLGQTAYLGQGGSHFAPGTVQLNGQTRQLQSYGLEPPKVSDAEKQGAATLEAQMLKRLEPGGSYTPTPLSNYAKPGLAENISSYGAAGVGGLGAIDQMMHGGSPSGAPSTGAPSGANKLINGAGSVANGITQASSLLGKLGPKAAGASKLLGGIGGKAVPLLGAATGAYDLIKGGSAMHNIMSGASTGASIGSIVPGLGTLVGGGIGAAVGGLRSLFGHKKKPAAGPTSAPPTAAPAAAPAGSTLHDMMASKGWV